MIDQAAARASASLCDTAFLRDAKLRNRFFICYEHEDRADARYIDDNSYYASVKVA